MIVSGKIFDFALLIATVVVAFLMMQRGRRGYLPKIRRLPAIDAMEEAVGRCAEMGRPIMFNPFWAELTNENAPQTFASFNCLSYVARLAAKLKVRLIVPYGRPEPGPILDEICREAYLVEGASDQYDPNSLIYLPEFSHVMGTIGIMIRENVGANIMIGNAYYATVLFCETGQLIGAFQIGGSATLPNVPYFITSCEFSLIGDEIFASGAYITKDPVMTSSIQASDWVKLALTVIGLVSILLLNSGYKDILTLLRM